MRNSILMTDENIGKMILQELVKIREDFKSEIRRLGDRLENCLNVGEGSRKCGFDVTNRDSPSSDNVNLILPELETPVAQDFVAANSQLPISESILEEKVESNCQEDYASTSVAALNSGCDFEQSRNSESVPTSIIPKLDIEEKLTPFPTSVVVRAHESRMCQPVLEEVRANSLQLKSFSAACDRVKHINETNEFDSKMCEKTKKLFSLPKAETFQCRICRLCFLNKSRLESHLRTHTDYRGHNCTVCTLSFKSIYSLQRHMRNHTGEQPYVCKECGKAFTRTDCLQRHLKIHYKRRNTGDETEEEQVVLPNKKAQMVWSNNLSRSST